MKLGGESDLGPQWTGDVGSARNKLAVNEQGRREKGGGGLMHVPPSVWVE